MRRDSRGRQGQGAGPASPIPEAPPPSSPGSPEDRPLGGGSVPGAGSPELQRHQRPTPARDCHVTPALPLPAARRQCQDSGARGPAELTVTSRAAGAGAAGRAVPSFSASS